MSSRFESVTIPAPDRGWRPAMLILLVSVWLALLPNGAISCTSPMPPRPPAPVASHTAAGGGGYLAAIGMPPNDP